MSADKCPHDESGWHILKPGEMRQLGDEIQSPSLGWIPVSEADIGRHQTDGAYLLPVRRRVLKECGDKCPSCGAVIELRWDRERSDCGIFQCGSTIRAGVFTSSKHCQERVAHAETRRKLEEAEKVCASVLDILESGVCGYDDVQSAERLLRSVIEKGGAS